MKMTTGKSERKLTCELTIAKNPDISVQIPCPYGSDAIAYAACRFLRGSQQLAGEYVEASYRMRLSSGKKRPPRRWCVVPAQLLELDRGWAYVEVSISAAGVTVERVALLDSLQDASGCVRKPRPAKQRIGVWRDAGNAVS